MKNILLWPIRFFKRWPKLTIIAIILLVLLVSAIYFLLQPKKVEYITELTVRGDLKQTVDAIGTVTSERDLKLQFPATGIIESVYVKEGDKVKAGQKLAKLRSSGLSADINSAAASVAAAKADLDTITIGTRPEELAIARASVESRRASLHVAETNLRSAIDTLTQAESKLITVKSETNTNLEGSTNTVRSTVSSQLSSLLTNVQSMKSLLYNNKLSDVFIKYDPAGQRRLNEQLEMYENEVNGQLAKFNTLSGYQNSVSALESIRMTADRVSLFYNDLYVSITNLPITSVLTIADRDVITNQIAGSRSSVQATLTTLDTTLQTLKNVPGSIDSRIAAEESAVISARAARDRAEADIDTYKTALQVEEASLRLKEAGSRPGDIAGAKARLNQAYASLQRAQDRYNDTIIKAPIDGLITKVNLKEGELLSTSFETASAITMLGASPYRIEMYIPEIDIPKVKVGQSGSIVLDAFAETVFPLVVSEIDPASVQVDGVTKYRAVLDFVHFENEKEPRIGMTGDAEILTAFAADVLQVPSRAVRRNSEGFEVVDILQPDNTVKPVSLSTGLEGAGGQLEVISGLTEGQTVVILQK